MFSRTKRFIFKPQQPSQVTLWNQGEQIDDTPLAPQPQRQQSTFPASSHFYGNRQYASSSSSFGGFGAVRQQENRGVAISRLPYAEHASPSNQFATPQHTHLPPPPAITHEVHQQPVEQFRYIDSDEDIYESIHRINQEEANGPASVDSHTTPEQERIMPITTSSSTKGIPQQYKQKNVQLLDSPATRKKLLRQSILAPDAPAGKFLRAKGSVLKTTSSVSNPIVNPNNVRLRLVKDLPELIQPIFEFSTFNAVQSECYEELVETDTSMVVNAPTAAGKTVILELALVRLILQGNGKAVYMAPTRSLCDQKEAEWKRKFRPVGLNVVKMTSDSTWSDTQAWRNGHIFVCTPEKWDNMTRGWKDMRQTMQSIKLFMMDEIHIINSDRGPTMEAVVSRMKMISADTRNTPVRFIAISATFANVQDVATWLSVSTPCSVRAFDQRYRPCPLEMKVIGTATKNPNMNMHDRSLNNQLPLLIKTNSDDRPTMVFCNTRKATEEAAEHIATHMQLKNVLTPEFEELRRKVANKKLAMLLSNGSAFHHAGLTSEDRRLIEQMFSDGLIHTLCATSTLAVGVNLPAHLVIIKSTTKWNGSEYEELKPSELLQMVGRAGRPQFDDKGIAIILTTEEHEKKWNNVVHGSEVIESCLHKNLIEHLAAEINLESVQSVDQALIWLQSTFLYQRVRKNPLYYRFKAKDDKEIKDSNPDEYLENLCIYYLQLLIDHDLTRFDDQRKFYAVTDLGALMCKHYIYFDTMLTFATAQFGSGIPELLTILSQAAEFVNTVKVHMGEKGHFNTFLKQGLLKYPLPENRVRNVQDKVNLLIQTHLQGVTIPGIRADNMCESRTIVSSASRLVKVLIELAATGKDGIGLKSALDLSRSLRAGVWCHSNRLLEQLEGIGPANSAALVQASIRTIQNVLDSNDHAIEYALHRNPPAGRKIKEAAKKLPVFGMSISQYQQHGVSAKHVELYIRVSVENASVMKAQGKQFAFLLVSHGSNLLLYKEFTLTHLMEDAAPFKVSGEVNPRHKLPISCVVGSDKYLGIDIVRQYFPTYDKLLPGMSDEESSVAPPRTELLTGDAAQQFQLTDLSNAREECKHACKDRRVCGHKCCQQGILRRKSKTVSTKPARSVSLTVPQSAKSVLPSTLVDETGWSSTELLAATEISDTQYVNSEEHDDYKNDISHLVPSEYFEAPQQIDTHLVTPDTNRSKKRPLVMESDPSSPVAARSEKQQRIIEVANPMTLDQSESIEQRALSPLVPRLSLSSQAFMAKLIEQERDQMLANFNVEIIEDEPSAMIETGADETTRNEEHLPAIKTRSRQTDLAPVTVSADIFPQSAEAKYPALLPEITEEEIKTKAERLRNLLKGETDFSPKSFRKTMRKFEQTMPLNSDPMEDRLMW